MKEVIEIIIKPVALLAGIMTLAVCGTAMIVGMIQSDGVSVALGASGCIFGGLLVASVWEELKEK